MARIKRNVARKRRHKRVRKSIYGTLSRPRLNVFRSLSNTYVQVIDDEGGKTLVSTSTIDKSLSTKLKGKSKVEQAQVVGEEIATRAKEQGITQVVFDRGGYKYSGRVKALADGARKNGLEF
jgi:large subunit ribosomal protein L18